MNIHARPRTRSWRIWSSTIFAVLLVMAGCATAEEKAHDEPEDTDIEVLRIGVPNLPDSLDPIIGLGNVNARVLTNIYETLIYADQPEVYELGAMLAHSWEQIDDYTIRFELTEGVRFHDGSEMTAEDVEFSFERVRSGIEGAELAASLMSVVDEVEIIDDYTVDLRTAEPDPLLEQRLASTWGSWILPKDYIEAEGDDAFARAPIGTGPYEVESITPDRIVLNRFEDYWGPAAPAERVEYIVYPEDSPRVTALMTGEVDMIAQLPIEQVSIVEERDGVRPVTALIDNFQMLRINTDAPGLTDKRLRQALSLGIDRELIVEELWEGTSEVPNGHQFPSYGDLYFDEHPTYAYDPDRARELVEESDYDGEVIDYELRPGYYPFDAHVADVIVDMWNDIGVDAQVVYTDSYDWTGVATWSNSARFPDPAGGLWLLWSPGTTADNWWPGDDEFTRIGEELSAEMDPAERQRLARELMERWDEVVPGIPLNYTAGAWGIRDGLEWVPNPSHVLELRSGKLSGHRCQAVDHYGGLRF